MRRVIKIVEKDVLQSVRFNVYVEGQFLSGLECRDWGEVSTGDVGEPNMY